MVTIAATVIAIAAAAAAAAAAVQMLGEGNGGSRRGDAVDAAVGIVADGGRGDGAELRRRLQQIVEDVDDRVDRTLRTTVFVLQIRTETTCEGGEE